ncbi:uncharacterized protein LOC125234716 [Leguminivora glycinivorella]|uniref:uncharacterized protein LOC125234716 n=1 Tax=Leguminivora glycinivorella TaxID=1035111 RepID=UPI00200D3B84|nr:uncharacterized protein LOC125234716 [Leguminivora glycinivorella]
MAAETEMEVLREYYANSDYLSSPEGIMKLIAILGCLCSAVLFLAGGGCAGAAALAAGAASLAFLAVGLLAVQLTATLLGAPLFAPHAWLYCDVVGSSVLGALLVLSGTLSLTLCELRGFVSYVHAPLAVCNAALVVGGAVATYAAVTRRWDAARGPSWEPRREPPPDVDV